ncbi:transglutaminase family protein [Bythopirellula polymerisocia]|uniref:Transglutaminase-like domain-containing protein n=1 Tax=Bythopirellula polymerisocia TaxID=2528003 RepID=A0A5C6CIZ2_9BACT|nr:transglutaminase family protein [Bythopirellula polymerisocia]TWU24550.1 hypothetical protein Pla144_34340 [Bythopirellula polymerisocia]
MTIRIALNHRTSYRYDRLVTLSPQIIRLRPAPHARTPVLSYSLKVRPAEHFENWQQDPHGNFLNRSVFPEKVRELSIEVDLIADMTVINPFDFFVEPSADEWPFVYDPWLAKDLRPFLECEPPGPKLAAWLAKVDRTKRNTVNFAVDLNRRLQEEISYLIRMEPGVQTCEETLTNLSGSCRDSAWLLVQILRNLGIAARFASGYLIQLVADVKSLDGPSGTDKDFTDLHAWTEAYIPGAGWIGLDPTSGLLTGEGHIPLACTPDPMSAAPITGGVDACEMEFDYAMSVSRIHEDPRVTKPYTDEEWQKIEAVGHSVDQRLQAGDVRLTMGGEPTFVSIDDMEGAEWTTAAVGPTKRLRAADLFLRMQRRFAPNSLLHFGQGKWYPGESLPRWAFSCYWRSDGEPIWNESKLVAEEGKSYGHTAADAERLVKTIAENLEVGPQFVIPAYEDVCQYIAQERRLPVNVNPRDNKLKDPEARARLARIAEQGLGEVAGYVLPIRRQWWQAQARWESSLWLIRSDSILLLPGDSPLGLRLPLDSLPWSQEGDEINEVDPSAPRDSLAPHPYQRGKVAERVQQEVTPSENEDELSQTRQAEQTLDQKSKVVKTAMCVEPRNGTLHVFMPPTERLEDYLDLVAAVEQAAETLDTPVVLEGYVPPKDHRLNNIKVTPDPGVIEVNTHPAATWDELVESTTALYEEAFYSRLATEKFDLDGRHTGTGGGNHVVLGGPTPQDSPFLRRPDLLSSLVAFWNNHPSLSYLFSSSFIGPTSQAPRVDEGRRDALYELEIACDQVPDPFAGSKPIAAWEVDRIFRNLLVDLTGNTHRAEFCIDKLYSPDTSTGRLGLVEFRGFEMPPHARMSLTQQLLLRSLVALFWEQPYQEKLIHWGTRLHDQFLLPHFVWSDLGEVIDDCREFGIPLERDWFASHFEFRFPRIGTINQLGIEMELRQGVELWYVLGEEPGGGGTTRYVDSSVERLQVKVTGMNDERHFVTCNGRRVPLRSTGTAGEYVAAVRYRAWQPPSCLHPLIGVHTPLVFDLFDSFNGRSIGGCTYHVSHPAGRNYETFPVNAYEAEARRASRFFAAGHTPGPMRTPELELNPLFPLTLDLRRVKPDS